MEPTRPEPVLAKEAIAESPAGCVAPTRDNASTCTAPPPYEPTAAAEPQEQSAGSPITAAPSDTEAQEASRRRPAWRQWLFCDDTIPEIVITAAVVGRICVPLMEHLSKEPHRFRVFADALMVHLIIFSVVAVSGVRLARVRKRVGMPTVTAMICGGLAAIALGLVQYQVDTQHGSVWVGFVEAAGEQDTSSTTNIQ